MNIFIRSGPSLEMIAGTEGGTDPVIAAHLPDGRQYWAVKKEGGYTRWIVDSKGVAVKQDN